MEKIIFSPSVARGLLKKGHRIVDIKPSKINPDRTVFVFDATKDFMNDFLRISQKDVIKDAIPTKSDE